MTAAFDDSSTIVRETAGEAVANLTIVLEQVALGRLRGSATTHRPAATAVAGLSALLRDGDFYPDEAIAAFAWPLIIQAGGLAEMAGTRLQLTARGRKALSAAPHATLRALWRAWVSKGTIDEFSRIDTIKGQRSKNVLSSAITRRKIVATALAELPVGTWMNVEDLFTLMQSEGLDPTVHRNERSLWRLYIAEPQYGSLGYAGFHDWALLQGRYTLAVLFEYAATLGLLDVAFTDPAGARWDFRENWGADELPYLSRYDGLLAVRLNTLGAYVLGISSEPPPTPEPAACLRVLPNHDVVALGDVPPGDAMTLSAFAESTADRTWRLSTASLLAGIAGGRSLDELDGLLKRASEGPLPGTVTRLLADTTERSSALSDRGVVRLVECRDAATAVLIARDPRTARFCVLLGDQHLAVGAEYEAEFRQAVVGLGYALRT